MMENNVKNKKTIEDQYRIEVFNLLKDSMHDATEKELELLQKIITSSEKINIETLKEEIVKL